MYFSVAHIRGPFSSIQPFVVGCEQTKPGPVYGPFRRKRMVLQYVLSGRGVFECPYGTYTLTKGDIFVMHKGDLVSYRSDEKDPWKYIWVEFELNDQLNDCFDCGVIHNETAEPYFKELLKAEKMSVGQSSFVTSCIYRIFSVLETEQQPIRYGPYVEKAIAYIGAVYLKRLSVETVADYVGLNRSYFCQLFKRQTGQSPKEYLEDYLIDRTAHMLIHSELSVSEIAETAGYNDTAAFSKAFKRKMGVSPLRYRQIKKHTSPAE